MAPTRSCHCRRCSKCRNTDRKRLTENMRRQGTPTGLVDANPARKHINWLRANNVGLSSIAQAANVARETVRRIGRGHTQRITREVSESLLGVTLNDGYFINATGTRRRIQALCRLGWTQQAQAEHAGLRQQDIAYYASPQRLYVEHTTKQKVAAMYEALHMKPGPSRVSADRAAAKGWAAPLAWDDDDIDDPAALPQTTGQPKGKRPSLPDSGRLVREVNVDGVDVVASRYKVQPASVNYALRRAGYRAGRGGNQLNRPHYRKVTP